MPYPSTLSTISYPNPTNPLSSPSHSSVHGNTNDAIAEIQRFVGTLSSTAGTLMYDVRAAASNGGGHVQTAEKGGTGQTAFTKGDLLVAQNSSTLTKLAAGTSGQVLAVDPTQALGLGWATSSPPNVQSFLSTGTWNRPSVAATGRVFVQLWAGGGSGGSEISGGGKAGGGGGGGYQAAWLNASTLGTSQLVVVGVGGASVLGADGNAGTNTVFGTTSSLVVAYAGGGGASTAIAGGAGGGGGGGLFGEGGSTTDASAGIGGASGWVGAASVFASGGGVGAGSGTATPQNAYLSAGGGGDAANGGSAVLGGGGGGGAAGSAGTGGISQNAGGGGAGGFSVAGTAGGFPSGGGGGAARSSTARSGKGGDGMAIITTFV